MRGEDWNYREMTSAMASGAELTRDTILYNNMAEGGAGGGGGGVPSKAGPMWIGANPNVFYRMAYAARTLYSGLEERELYPPDSYALRQRGDTLELYGDLAAKELAGES